MIGRILSGEAFLLGLASGPACIAACGPVLVPSLLAGQPGLRPNLRFLTVFLGARLAGYLLFAILAWELGILASVLAAPHLHIIGLVYVLLALALIWYALTARHSCSPACAGSKLVTITGQGNGLESPAKATRRRTAGPAALGFLTGLNLCPPFVAAGIRAASLGSVAEALLFFSLFFLGTSIWFVPFAGLGCIVRTQAVVTVARMAMALIAVSYLAMGIVMLLGRKGYGY